LHERDVERENSCRDDHERYVRGEAGAFDALAAAYGERVVPSAVGKAFTL
jgi:hypothetical protein